MVASSDEPAQPSEALVLEIGRDESGSHERVAHFARAVGGMTNLSIATTLLPYLSPKTLYYVLYMSAKNVADNCTGQAPRLRRAVFPSSMR